MAESKSSDTGVEDFPSELATLAAMGLSDMQLKEKIYDLKGKYKVYEMDAIIYEAAILGKIISNADFDATKKDDRRRFIASIIGRVKHLKLDEGAMASVLGQLKNYGLISKFKFFEVEKNLLGANYSMSEADRNELEFFDAAFGKYRARGDVPFGKQVQKYDDEKFELPIFMRDLVKIREKIDDKLLFNCKASTFFILPKEGFVVSSQAIYSFGWSTPILLRDIEDIYVEKREILVRVANSAAPRILYAKPLKNKEEFVGFMKELLGDYRRIFGIAC